MKKDVITWKQLSDICKYISINYLDLKTEFEEVKTLLSIAETFGAAYLNKEMVEFHFKVEAKEYTLLTTSLLEARIKNLGEYANNEFFQGINIVNIYDVLLEEIRKGNTLSFVWGTRKKLDYIIYGLKRIAYETDMAKKGAILKGMIAYY